MALAQDASFTGDPRLRGGRPPGFALPVSFRAIPPLAAAIDAAWVLSFGVATGVIYDLIIRGSSGDIRYYMGCAIAVAALFLAFAWAADLHRPSNLLRLRPQIKRAVLIWIMTFVCLATVVFLLKIGAMFSRAAVVLFFASGLGAIVTSRVVLALTLASVLSAGALARRRVVLVGTAEQLASNALIPALERYGYEIVRTFVLPRREGESGEVSEALGEPMRELVAFARATPMDEIILAIPWAATGLIERTECVLRVLPIPVKLVPDAAISRLFERPLFELGPTTAVELQRAPLSATQLFIKQIVDKVIAAVGLILLMPLFAVTAVAIRLESPGPAFFLQARAGFNGRPFRILKFRTMSTLDDGAVVKQATRNDPRVTRLGRLLRALSIDEIPQLLNVLRGEMSLVGPRPHALAHDDQYDRLMASYAMRRKMKPGITGWAQVNGYRGETPEVATMQRRVEYDLWYIEYWSAWLDIRILLMTVVQILRPRNVY